MNHAPTLWMLALLSLAFGLSACDDETSMRCADRNENGICDTKEPGHSLCPADERDAQGLCPSSPPRCTGTQLPTRDGCEDCPDGDIALMGSCVTPSVRCADNEIIEADSCTPCGEGAVARHNECVPICRVTQILVHNRCIDCVDGFGNGGQNVCVPIGDGICGDGQNVVDGACCDDVNGNFICDPDEPGAAHCPASERDEDGHCPTLCHDDLRNESDRCVCLDADLDGLCDTAPEDTCVGHANGEDLDGDGFCADLDCDDSDPLVYPGALELCSSAVVNDCDAPCYQRGGCSDVDAGLRKAGRVTRARVVGEETVYADVSSFFNTPGQVYFAVGSETLSFCSYPTATNPNGDIFQGRVRASGAAQDLRMELGPSSSATYLDGKALDSPIVMVSDDARVHIRGLGLERSVGSSIATHPNARGVDCLRARVIIEDLNIREMRATDGAGMRLEACDAELRGSVTIEQAQAERGAAIMMLDGSVLHAPSFDELRIRYNTVAASLSGAVHLETSTFSAESAAPSARVDLYANTLYSDAYADRDIFAGHGATLQLSPLYTDPGAGDNVRTAQTTYRVDTSGGALACDAGACVFP